MNNFQRIAKKYLFDLLKDHYFKNEIMISRLTHYLTNENDVKEFCQIVADSWNAGYVKAVEDYKSKLLEMGYTVEIKEGKSN